MAEDDSWSVPYADLDAVRKAQHAGQRKIWPWALVASVLVVALAAGGGVAWWFFSDSMSDLKAHGKVGQRMWFHAHAYAEADAANNQETAEVSYTLEHHLANTPQSKREAFKQTVTLPWERAVDLEGSLIGVAFTVTVPSKSNRNLQGPTCAVSLDSDYLDNKAAPGYDNAVACQWKFTG